MTPIALDGTPVAVVSAALAQQVLGRRGSDRQAIQAGDRRSVDRRDRRLRQRRAQLVRAPGETVYRPISQDAPYTGGVRHPHGRRPDRAWPVIFDARSARSIPTSRSRRSTPLDTLVEERAAGFAFIARALGVVGADRAGAVDDGHLQPDGVSHHAAHPGDRRADGARRRPLAGDSRRDHGARSEITAAGIAGRRGAGLRRSAA